VQLLQGVMYSLTPVHNAALTSFKLRDLGAFVTSLPALVLLRAD